MSYIESHPLYEELAQENVRLVQPRLEHAQASLAWVSSPEVIRLMGERFDNVSLEGEKKRIEEILLNEDEYSWMIECDGKAIGNVCINSIHETSEKLGMKAGNLTVLIGEKDYWGKGVATNVCSSVLSWAKRAGFECMAARALKENIGSINTLKKLGFTETGTEPFEGSIDGKPSVWHNFSIDLSSPSIR